MGNAKAAKKLAKKLGREPTEAEVAKYVAKKEGKRKAEDEEPEPEPEPEPEGEWRILPALLVDGAEVAGGPVLSWLVLGLAGCCWAWLAGAGLG